MTVGWEEIFVLMVFALVIFGPKRLPEIGRQIGRFIGEIRRLSHEFEAEVRDVAEPFHRELTAMVDPEEAEIRKVEAEAGVADKYALDDDHSTFMPLADPPPTPRPPSSP
jgi:Sec-independent protein translocase protein TatA